MPDRTVAPAAGPARAAANKPDWIQVWSGRHGEYLARYTDADGRRHDWHVCKDRLGGRGERSPLGWYAWPEIPDRKRWDGPLFLDSRLADARDEFLLLVVHGWGRPFGYADGDGCRPIYAKDGIRRERAHILAELTGDRICRGCSRPRKTRADGTIVAHIAPDTLDRCRGTHGEPAAEPVHPGVSEWR